MATRRFALNPGAQNTDVVESVGNATSSAFIEVVVDVADTVVNEGGGTRKITQEELINALENIKEYIMRQNNWPPA